MKLLPFENTIINSPLSGNEVENNIKNNIIWNTELENNFTKTTLKDYEGFIENKTFKIRRILKSGRNSFIPIVSGSIFEKPNGSEIKLKIRLNRVTIILAFVFTSFTTSIFLSDLSKKPNKQITEFLNNDLTKKTLSQEDYENLEYMNKSKKIDLKDLLLLTAPYLMCTIFFNYEARIVKDKLNSILKTEKNIC